MQHYYLTMSLKYNLILELIMKQISFLVEEKICIEKVSVNCVDSYLSTVIFLSAPIILPQIYLELKNIFF